MKESGCGEEGWERGMEDGAGEGGGARGRGKDGLGRDANDCVARDGRAKTPGVGGNT